jgi:chaperonin cofactor prefoldin
MTNGNINYFTAKPDAMKEMKEQIEQLKKQVDSLPRNMVNIHMHDGHDDHHVK